MKKILFVCSGNTCRSPMAQALLGNEAKKRGLDIIALSAGIFANEGEKYSENARLALKEKGIDFDGSSKKLGKKDLEECDFAFGMNSSVAHALCASFPESAEKIYVFPKEISDPYGKDLNAYKDCLEEIKSGIDLIVKAAEENKL
ncbi:MAG: low molecular weight protein arginine phosphatase [Clostridia bacterium]|nr:low molecular weight protein arginine phosphatase [Clostridia bacterium]